MDLPAYATAWLAEDPIITAARTRAREAGISAAGPDAGSLLRSLAQVVRARTAVETGTGGGVSGLWLLAGMRVGGVLTSIDVEPEHQRLARQAFSEAGVPTSRARLITGDASDVLPRLTDGGYDLVHLDSGSAQHTAQFSQARRLVRPGGVIVVSGLFRSAREDSKDTNGASTRALLDLVGADGPSWPTLLSVGEGTLVLSTVSNNEAT